MSWKWAILITHIQRAKVIYNDECLIVKINHLKKNFRRNRYSNHTVMHALVAKQKSQTHKEKLASITMIPHQQHVSNKISRLLAKYNSLCCGDKYLRSVKDKLGLKVSGTYCPASAARCTLERWAETTKTRCKGHTCV
jgi:hypothetical protein